MSGNEIQSKIYEIVDIIYQKKYKSGKIEISIVKYILSGYSQIVYKVELGHLSFKTTSDSGIWDVMPGKSSSKGGPRTPEDILNFLISELRDMRIEEVLKK